MCCNIQNRKEIYGFLLFNVKKVKKVADIIISKFYDGFQEEMSDSWRNIDVNRKNNSHYRWNRLFW